MNLLFRNTASITQKRPTALADGLIKFKEYSLGHAKTPAASADGFI
ncbi:MAG: hypothetical protein HRT44_07575 [Bdellovibrionales bacterium]|nr:hypothetical protein [Bdellovibrionales bacterium]